MWLAHVSDCHPLYKDCVINVDTCNLLTTKTHNTPQHITPPSPSPMKPYIIKELGIYYINTVISLAKKDRNKGNYQHINRQFYTKSLLF